MRWLVRFALRFRLLVLAFAAGVLVLGVTHLGNESVEALPEFSPPYTEIQTEALGLSAEEVEQLITVPLEADLLNGVEGARSIRSESLPGLSSIVLVFAEGTDIYRARQLVEERLTQAHALPNVSKPPALLPPMSSSSRVLLVGLRSETLTPIEQSIIARWTIRPRLMGVSGVANVSIWGMRDQQLQVQVDPVRLRQSGVTLEQVVRSAGNAQVVSPLSFLEASTPGTGGFIETPQQRLQVRHVLERMADPTALAQVPVEGTAGRLRLGDVAEITVDHQPLIGDAVVAGGPGLLLVVEKLPDADTMDVTRDVETAMDALRPGLAGLTTDTSAFRPASYLQDASRNLGRYLALAAGLLGLALVLSGFRWRALVIPLVTVPVALLGAMLVLDWLGFALNALAVAGLAAGILLLVSDSVATTSVAARTLPSGRADDDADGTPAADGWVRSRRPLDYVSAILLLAVLPLALLPGRPGAFLAPMVAAYSAAVLAALLVAVTLTPVLAFLLLGNRRGVRRRPRPAWAIGGWYLRALGVTLGRPRWALVGTIALTAVCVILLALTGLSFVPAFQDRDLVVRLAGPVGMSNPQMTSVTTGLANRLRVVPGVAGVGAHVGRAVTGDRVTDVSSSDIWVRIAADADYAETVRAVNERVASTRGVRHQVSTQVEQSVREVAALVDGMTLTSQSGVDVLAGASQPVVVRLFGQDQAQLSATAATIREAVAEVDGMTGARIVDLPVQESIAIEVDLARAERAGLTPGHVRRSEATLLQGIQVGSVFREQKVFDVVVQGAPVTRRSIDDVQDLLIDRPGGGHVRLGDVADVRLIDSPAVIRRDAVSRYVDIVADVDSRSADAVRAAVTERVQALSLPLEYHAEVVSGDTGNEVDLTGMLRVGVLSGLAALLLLQALFRSWRAAMLVCLATPPALLGATLAAVLIGDDVSLGAVLGLLVTLGFALSTSVALVSTTRDEERAWPRRPRVALLRSVALRRLAPTLASAAALAAMVLAGAVLGDGPGLEVLHPMGVVVLAGVATALPVALFVVPALYLRYGPRAVLTADDEEDRPVHAAAVHPVAESRASGNGDTSQSRDQRPGRQPAATGAEPR